MADLREREDRQLFKDALSPKPACATPFALDSLRRASTPPEESAAIRKHIAGCVRCQAELRLLAEFEGGAPRPGEEEAVSSIEARLERRFSTGQPGTPAKSGHSTAQRRRWPLFRRFQAGGFAVAAALLVAAVAIGLREVRQPELGAVPQTRMVLRSAEVTVLSPADDVREAPAELRWQPWASAASYSVRVMEVDRTELWRSETGQTAIALPPEVRARIVPRKPLLWEVVARDANGGTLASSGTHRFQIRTQP